MKDSTQTLFWYDISYFQPQLFSIRIWIDGHLKDATMFGKKDVKHLKIKVNFFSSLLYDSMKKILNIEKFSKFWCISSNVTSKLF